MAYKSHALKIGTNWIGGILKQSARNAARIEAKPTAGSVYAQQITINEVKNSFMFTTLNVQKALAVLGFSGLALGSGVSAELYEIQWTNDGAIAAGSVHRKLVFANGRALLRRISGQHRADVSGDIEVFAISSDGTTNPVAFTGSVAMPALVDDARHTILGGTLGGVSVGCMQSFDIDFGIDIESLGCNSDIFDTRLQVNAISPKITVNTLAAELVGGSFPTTGKLCTHADSFLKLRKRTPKLGTFVADATAEHIFISFDGTALPTTMFDGSNNDDGTATIETTCRFDGTNTPIVFNPAYALA